MNEVIYVVEFYLGDNEFEKVCAFRTREQAEQFIAEKQTKDKFAHYIWTPVEIYE